MKSILESGIEFQYLMSKFFPSMDKHPSGCWTWIGYCAKDGYGAFAFEGKYYQAHRVSYEIFWGAIPPKYDVHHVCENKQCVNPVHLEAISRMEHAGKHTDKHLGARRYTNSTLRKRRIAGRGLPVTKIWEIIKIEKPFAIKFAGD